MPPTVIFFTTILKISLFALFIRVSCSQQTRKNLYVTTQQHQSCHSGANACYTIAEYLYGNRNLFASNTTLHFLLGTHTVNGSGTHSSTVVIADLTDFGVEGLDVPTGEPPVVTVECSHPVNFHFTNITRLHIHNIKFTHCSPINPTFNLGEYKYKYWGIHMYVSGSLELENLLDVELHNVHITESSGFGLVGLNLLGTTTVSYSHFYNNSGNASTITLGGNALMFFEHTKQEHYSIKVFNSKFIFGSNPLGSGGLGIILGSEVNIKDLNIHVSSCDFNCNFGDRGADLYIYLQNSNPWYEYTTDNTVIGIDNCSFNNSVSALNGGSCYIDWGPRSDDSGTHIHFSHSTFSGNSAGRSSGAVYIEWSVGTSVNFINCSFLDNRAAGDGGAIYSEGYMYVSWCVFSNNIVNGSGGHIGSVHLQLSNSWFESGSAIDSGGAIFLMTWSIEQVVINCTFISNTAYNGGGLAMGSISTVNIKNCTFIENKAIFGGGVYANAKETVDDIHILVVHCYFVRNSAVSGGGLGLSIIHGQYYNMFIGGFIHEIEVYNTQFSENIAKNEGSAINQDTHIKCYTIIEDCNNYNSITLTITNGLFSNNVVNPLTYDASTITVNSITSFHLISSQILSNKGSGIHVRNTPIFIEGHVVIAHNTAYVGGALFLDCYHSLVNKDREYESNIQHAQSVLNLIANSSVVVTNNTALTFGGGIAVNELCGTQTCTQNTPWDTCTIPCFFSIPNTTMGSYPMVHMEENRAMIAGNVFYGGPLETCTYISNPQLNSIQMFGSIFTNNQNLSTMDVVSDPVRVCFCVQQVTEGPYCLKEITVTVYQGQEFNVTAIAVTPLTDASSLFVKAELHTQDSQGKLGALQKAQEQNRSCQNLTYSVRTSQARSHNRLLRWVIRIKPLLDAYTGPYRDKHRYWTGFMLLTRILLFVAFAVNFTGDPKLNLLIINAVVAGVLVLLGYVGKLYKSSLNRTLEVVYLLNLLVLSAVTLFLRGQHSSSPLAQEITVCTMVGVSFLLFVFTLCWHVYNYTSVLSQVRQKLASVFTKLTQRPPQPHNAGDTVGGAGDAPVQGTQAQPTVSVIDMRELREPLLTDN